MLEKAFSRIYSLLVQGEFYAIYFKWFECRPTSSSFT